QDRAELERICDALQLAAGANHRLCLLVESQVSGQETKLWRLGWQQPVLAYEICPAVSFGMVLRNHTAPALSDRRRLALTFARSLLQLYESPWLSERWDKESLQFFFQTSGDVDMRRPYISTSFDNFPIGSEPPDLNLLHRSRGILQLGLLLIETHTWKPIENFYTEGERTASQPTSNTDLQAAWRVHSSMRDCFGTYLSAISACLSVSWVAVGMRVSLEDAETRSGLYHGVVKPLEMEVSLAD
ncbi:hypothetical protein QBC40DRAFT_161064, partial [Triangularia verruculosa]